MIRKKINQHLNTQLPAYINGTLSPVQQKIVGFWLERDEQAQATAENLKTLQTAIRHQPRPTPSPAILSKIQAQIHSQQAAANRQKPPLQRQAIGFPILLLSFVTLLLAAAVMWQALPPGIVLQWSVEGQAPESFLVYRAEVDSESQFQLLDKIPASQVSEYTFTDVRLLPGQSYVYRVEGLNASGQPAASQTITGQAIDALPGQLALLLVLVLCCYFVWVMVQQWRPMTTAAI